VTDAIDPPTHSEGAVRDFEVIPYDIARRCAATQHPETNPLVALGSVAEISNTCSSKSIVISIEPSPTI